MKTYEGEKKCKLSKICNKYNKQRKPFCMSRKTLTGFLFASMRVSFQALKSDRMEVNLSGK